MAPVCHVFCEGDTIWDAMLMCTDISNNHNKYYALQLLKHDTKDEYFAWFKSVLLLSFCPFLSSLSHLSHFLSGCCVLLLSRWGRVGKIAGKTLVEVRSFFFSSLFFPPRLLSSSDPSFPFVVLSQCGANLEKAKKEYNKKLKEKTRKYRQIERDYSVGVRTHQNNTHSTAQHVALCTAHSFFFPLLSTHSCFCFPPFLLV
jgi:hypothetical protein